MRIKKTRLANIISTIIRVHLKKIFFRGSKKYWEGRYAAGGNSGAGSYGKLAMFKAETINSFVEENRIDSVIEFGCGDGNQLSLFRIPKYVGLDVSGTAIKLCMRRFEKDRTKSFFLYDPECFRDNSSVFGAQVALSLDVIYHLIEDDMFEAHMRHLFSAAHEFVIVYSSDSDSNQFFRAPHCRSRVFSRWIERNLSDWKLVRRIKNAYPDESLSDFFIYKKDGECRNGPQ